MSKYVVTTNRIYLTDEISVTQGVFDSDDVDVEESRIKELCKQYPADIAPYKEGDTTKSSNVDEDKEPAKTTKEGKDPGVQAAVDAATDKAPAKKKEAK